MSDPASEHDSLRDIEAACQALELGASWSLTDESESALQTTATQLGEGLEQQGLTLQFDQSTHAQDVGSRLRAESVVVHLERIRLDAHADDMDIGPTVSLRNRHQLAAPEVTDRNCEASRCEFVGQVIGPNVVELDWAVDSNTPAPASSAVPRCEQRDVCSDIGEYCVQVAHTSPLCGSPNENRLRKVEEAPKPPPDPGVSAADRKCERRHVLSWLSKQGDQVDEYQLAETYGQDRIRPLGLLTVTAGQQLLWWRAVDRERLNVDPKPPKRANLAEQEGVRDGGIMACEISYPHSERAGYPVRERGSTAESADSGLQRPGRASKGDPVAPMPRIAFIDYFPTHYRRKLYEEIGRRADADFFFFSDERRERWWNPNIPTAPAGAYHSVQLPRYRLAGEPVMPGVARRILAGRYDAVIKSPNGKVMLPLVYSAAKARGVGFVLWLGMWHHPETPFHRLSKPLMEAIYRGSGAIVGYGEHVRRFVLETPGVRPEKVFVAGQAVDPARFQVIEPICNGAQPNILYVGQFEEVKGLPYLLDAFDQVAGSGARLRLVGGGSQEIWVRDRTQGRHDVELVGFRSQDAVAEDLSHARCLVLPSVTTKRDRECWGLVVNEAFHAGVPVVATDAVGAAAGGLIRDGRNGFVVPERDSEALGRALRRLVEDPVLAARMGDAGREDVAEFNYERMAESFLGAVDHAIATRRSTRR